MKITAISDTHGLYGKLNLSGGDVLIHAGDSCRHSDIPAETNFFKWLGKQPYKNKIYVPGNHDFVFEHPSAVQYFRETYPEVTILLDSQTVIDGVVFYGVPWTLPFYDWAFMKEEHDLIDVFAKVPDNTNVLITHGPSYNVLDECFHDKFHAGSKEQLARIDNLPNLKYHIFGHIHETYGVEKRGNVTHYNASVLNLKYELENAPHEFEV